MSEKAKLTDDDRQKLHEALQDVIDQINAERIEKGERIISLSRQRIAHALAFGDMQEGKVSWDPVTRSFPPWR
jgi:hypothetical protein